MDDTTDRVIKGRTGGGAILLFLVFLGVAVVVWKVEDAAQALFDVDNYETYVRIQSESALRGLASQYPYDSSDPNVTSLRGDTADIIDKLKETVKERLSEVGVEVIEARLNHLAYAPEIAAALLQRQQVVNLTEK